MRLPRAWWQAAPALLILLLFSLLPLLAVVRYATWDWSGLSPPTPVGLANFRRLLADAEFWQALLTTLYFALLTLPAFLWLSRAIAIAIAGLRLERFVKALLFLPGLITVGGSAIAWFLLYNPDYGLITELTGLALPWNTQPWAGLVYVALFTLWQSTGYGVLVVSAALKGIPEEVKEAARVDGANEAQVRRYIVSPLLRPTMLFLVVLGTVFAIQSYTAVFLLTRGAPFGTTRVVGYYLYEVAFERFQLGYGAALTLAIMLVTLVVAILQARLLGERR
ncbi:MAG: sugar ABC transporter permease [Truepera sp.]|nr:sugar ABC transporter permease [Truepera sp.]